MKIFISDAFSPTVDRLMNVMAIGIIVFFVALLSVEYVCRLHEAHVNSLPRGETRVWVSTEN